MSSFLVSDRTVHTIAHVLAEGKGCEWCDLIGQQLIYLNHKALHARYGDPMPCASWSEVEYRYSPIVPPRPIAALKAIRSWLYQCHEGDVPEDALYQQAESSANSLAMQIVSELPEYQEAAWGA